MSVSAGAGLEVVAIGTPTLGDRSYLVHDGAVASVIGPQRDIDRVLGLAAARGVRITHVLETHLHNDRLAKAGMPVITGACRGRGMTGAGEREPACVPDAAA